MSTEVVLDLESTVTLNELRQEAVKAIEKWSDTFEPPCVNVEDLDEMGKVKVTSNVFLIMGDAPTLWVYDLTNNYYIYPKDTVPTLVGRSLAIHLLSDTVKIEMSYAIQSRELNYLLIENPELYIKMIMRGSDIITDGHSYFEGEIEKEVNNILSDLLSKIRFLAMYLQANSTTYAVL